MDQQKQTTGEACLTFVTLFAPRGGEDTYAKRALTKMRRIFGHGPVIHALGIRNPYNLCEFVIVQVIGPPPKNVIRRVELRAKCAPAGTVGVRVQTLGVKDVEMLVRHLALHDLMVDVISEYRRGG